MALLRAVCCGISRLIQPRNVIAGTKQSLVAGCDFQLTNERHFRKKWGIHLRIMKARRKIAGADKLRRRNEFIWNYKSEIYAFSHRLHENISEETLTTAFVNQSYLQKEEEQRRQLDLPSQDIQLNLMSNLQLIKKGTEVISNYLEYYLPYCYPKLPTEGVLAVKDFLMSVPVLSHISSNLGTKDLIFSAEYPPEDATFADTFKAIVGSIAKDDSVTRAENFVLDFVCPQLIGKDVFEIWDLEDPLGVVNSILVRAGLKECEPRLIFEAGRNTIESVYHVGLYVNKMFMGRGPGETLSIATEMAAYDALRRLFGIRENEKPLPFGDQARKIDFKSSKAMSLAIKEWGSEDLKVYVKQ